MWGEWGSVIRRVWRGGREGRCVGGVERQRDGWWKGGWGWGIGEAEKEDEGLKYNESKPNHKHSDVETRRPKLPFLVEGA